MEIVLFLRHESLISPKIWDWILGFPQCSIREVDERLFGFWKADAGYGKAARGLEACISVDRLFALHGGSPAFSSQHHI